ncbi:TPA: hypothetical protein JAN03_20265 [Citrobacter freundii]|nr:hypothetical protein [Citrobacter freundii]
MKQDEFIPVLIDQLVAWHVDYVNGQEKYGDEDYPAKRDADDWMQHFQCWLQSKG